MRRKAGGMKGDASEKPGKRPEVVTGFFKDFPVKRKRQHVSSNRFGLTATGGNGYVRWRGLPRVRSESNVIQYLISQFLPDRFLFILPGPLRKVAIKLVGN